MRISNIIFIIGICFLITSVSACKQQELYEGDWLLVKIEHNGAQTILNTVNNEFSLTMDKSLENVSGRHGCNRWRGHVLVEDDHIQVKVSGVTKKKCRYPSQYIQMIANRFFDVIEEFMPYKLNDNHLILTIDKNERWIFSRQ